MKFIAIRAVSLAPLKPKNIFVIFLIALSKYLTKQLSHVLSLLILVFRVSITAMSVISYIGNIWVTVILVLPLFCMNECIRLNVLNMTLRVEAWGNTELNSLSLSKRFRLY